MHARVSSVHTKQNVRASGYVLVGLCEYSGQPVPVAPPPVFTPEELCSMEGFKSYCMSLLSTKSYMFASLYIHVHCVDTAVTRVCLYMSA